MAEHAYLGPRAGPPLRPMTELAPLGQGLAGPTCPERQPRPRSAGPAKPGWAAGPGAGGHAPAALQPNLVSTPGVQMKKLQVYNTAPQCDMAQLATRNANKTIKDMAGPHQKEAAIRAAAGAVRPWSAYAGLGERRGAQFAQALAQVAITDINVPSRFQPPNATYAENVAAAAKRVARPGTMQVDAPGAWSPVPGHPARELWPVDLHDPPKYCAGCRGGHRPENEQNPNWEPYTPAMRLTNLNRLTSMFQHALLKGQLCVRLNDSRIAPLKWTWKAKDKHGDLVEVQPRNMAKQDFIKQFSLMLDGIREGHEPYRYLATKACEAFMDTGSVYLAEAVSEAVVPLRLAMQTYEPSLVGHTLLVLQRYLKSHPKVPSALTPHLRQLLPPLALLRRRHFTVHLPPPFCVGAAGSFTGHGFAPETGNRKCPVCACPLDKEYDSVKRRQAAVDQAMKNPHLMGEDLPGTYSRQPSQGRWSKKYYLEDVIEETLAMIVELGKAKALRAVQSFVPQYSYCNPKD